MTAQEARAAAPSTEPRKIARVSKSIAGVGVAARWTPKLVQKAWPPISNYFLENYTRLPTPSQGQGCLNPTQALLLIQLVSFKRGAQHPYPSVRTLADRIGLSTRAVRTALGELEDRNLIRRTPRKKGSTNAFDMSGLFAALEELMDQDAKEAEEGELAYLDALAEHDVENDVEQDDE
jgi:DNA-binding transcriptional regulator YhcF (GntR family)